MKKVIVMISLLVLLLIAPVVAGATDVTFVTDSSEFTVTSYFGVDTSEYAPKPEYTRNDVRVFCGWATKPNCSDAKYCVDVVGEGNYTNTMIYPKRDTTLYATYKTYDRWCYKSSVGVSIRVIVFIVIAVAVGILLLTVQVKKFIRALRSVLYGQM